LTTSILKATTLVVAFVLFTGFQQPVVNDPLAVSLLKETTASYKKNKSYCIEFTRINTSVQGKEIGREKGKIWVDGSKYRLEMENQQVICDGKTMWAYLQESKEVNVYDYDETEDELAPNKVFDFYKEGCKVLYLGDVKSGKKVLASIDVETTNRKSNITKYRFVIDKKAKKLTRWILFEKGTNTQIAFVLNKYTPNPVIKEGMFIYKKTDFPGAKLIDLR
jgi:outer membrane lipoprotein-sorting protein